MDGRRQTIGLRVEMGGGGRWAELRCYVLLGHERRPHSSTTSKTKKKGEPVISVDADPYMMSRAPTPHRGGPNRSGPNRIITRALTHKLARKNHLPSVETNSNKNGTRYSTAPYRTVVQELQTYNPHARVVWNTRTPHPPALSFLFRWPSSEDIFQSRRIYCGKGVPMK